MPSTKLKAQAMEEERILRNLLRARNFDLNGANDFMAEDEEEGEDHYSSNDEDSSDSIMVSTSKVKAKTKPSTTAATARATKKPKTTNKKPLTAEQLGALSRKDLENHCMLLQQQLAALTSTSTTTSTSPTLSNPEQLEKRLTTLRNLITTQLSKSLKWTPSCKHGTAAFTQSFAVPDALTLLALTGEPKMFKYKKVDATRFQDVLRARVVGRSRYAELSPTGDVGVRFDEGEGIMKVTGKYWKGF